MRNYINAIRELLINWVNGIFWLLDAVVWLVGLYSKRYLLKWYHYLGIVSLGFLLSAIKVIAEKNKKLTLDIPSVALYLRKKESVKSRRLRIRNNHSKLPIINVKFPDIVTSFQDAGSKLVFHIEMDGENILEPHEERDCIFRASKNGKERTDDFFMAHLDKRFANTDFKVIVLYGDMSGNRYKMIYNMGKSGTYVIGLPKIL